MIVVDYFEDKNQDLWKSKLLTADWSAATFLVKLLDDNDKLKSVFGKVAKLFLLTAGDELIAFATLTEKDCIDAPEIFPWIGFVYTYPKYRNKGNSKFLLEVICEKAKEMGYSEVFLATDHENLYEHYGFTYIENRVDVYGENERVYRKKLK